MRHLSRLFLAFCSLLLAPCSPATEVAELGQGLTYLRIHSVASSAADLNAALLRPAALVLDLRYTADEPTAAGILRQELGSPATKPRLFVLVSPATPVPVVGAIAANSARLVTLGIKDARPAPQVVVAQTAEADRAAYAALESGTTLAQLVSGKMEKERFDEAALVKEFKNGNHDARPPEGAPAPGKEPTAPPTDHVLQRALHLHRALQALKR